MSKEQDEIPCLLLFTFRRATLFIIRRLKHYIFRDKAVVAPPTSLRKRYDFLMQMSQIC